jgi:hypothetical protein
MALWDACATTPRIEKMPAPTMPPMPIDTAAARPIWPAPAAAGGGLVLPMLISWTRLHHVVPPTRRRRNCVRQ